MKRVLSMILTGVLCISMLCSCQSGQATLKEEDIKAICELATLKCYYNNVAEVIKKGNWLKKDRKLWLEYQGVATIGIDLSQVEVEIKGNKIIVSYPAAKLLDIYPIKETLTEDSYIYSQDGFLIKNKIDAEDQNQAMIDGQNEMEAAVLENTSMFARAEKRAIDLIKNHIDAIGNATGQSYEIEWKKIN